MTNFQMHEAMLIKLKAHFEGKYLPALVMGASLIKKFSSVLFERLAITDADRWFHRCLRTDGLK